MASIKYGAIVTEIKGKVGGTIFQAGRGSGVVKNAGIQRRGRRLAARNGYNLIEQKARTTFSVVTKAWQGLTDIQRNSWLSLVPIWTFLNKFGEPYEGTAYQIFCSCNMNALALDQSIIEDAPVEDAAVDPVLTFTDYSISGDFESEWTNAAASGQLNFVQLSRPVSPTTPYTKSTILANAVATYGSPTTQSIKAGYDAALGYTPPLGSLIYVYAYTTKPGYPRKQFVQIYKCNVVA